jgi:pimeloyl-ACP methyl ester carboxylesterase
VTIDGTIAADFVVGSTTNTAGATAGTPDAGWAPIPPTTSQLTAWNLDPSWSRFIDVTGHDGVARRWHVLDASPPNPLATIVCVHGNPTWGYAWASFLRRFGTTHRVIAIDQLGMDYSERTAQRRFATRVADLDDVIRALDLTDGVPLFLAAHDWGGAIAMGWAVDHVDRRHVGGEVRLTVLDAVDPGALLAFDQHFHGAVGQLEHL